ncbi:RES family NAD+ phosphorylase [archaeon]|jgi:hypothetical protein|nr:RES family NAD+ phosphorylase [archaeon]
MKLYRVVDTDYSGLYDAFSGIGAGKYGGRWNEQGHNTIYTSTTMSTAIAEKGFYSIINNLFTIRHKKHFTKYDQSKVIDLKYCLIEATFKEFSIDENDFTDSHKLSSALKDTSLGTFAPTDATYSPWESLPGRWTSMLGSTICSQNQEGIKALSARGPNGKNCAIFHDNFLLSNIKVINRYDLFLSAVMSTNKKKWNGKGKFSENYIFYEIPKLDRSGSIKVINKVFHK